MVAHDELSADQPGREYPYMWGMANAIFLLLAIGAVLDPEPQSLWPKLTGSAALLVAGIKQAPGLNPTYGRTVRAFTAVLLLADVVLIALIWTIR